MTEFDSGISPKGQCRCGASDRRLLGSTGDVSTMSLEDLQRLVRALQASHRELEAQNGSLQQLHQEAEAARTLLERRAAERAALAERRGQQLHRLASELTRVEQRERRRIARILHDHLQQQLVAVRMKLNKASRYAQDETLLSAIREADALVNESIETSRCLACELSPPVLHESGLQAALRWLATWKREKHGLMVDLRGDGDAEPVEEELRVLLFQIVQELLFNVVKHAQTDRACVEVSQMERGVQVVVSDEGVGFDPGELDLSRTSARGFGLSSVSERLEVMGGMLHIDAAPGRGTRVTVRVPCQRVPGETEDQDL